MKYQKARVAGFKVVIFNLFIKKGAIYVNKKINKSEVAVLCYVGSLVLIRIIAFGQLFLRLFIPFGKKDMLYKSYMNNIFAKLISKIVLHKTSN